jgi:probable HAF family extracellular repeat protein
MRRTILAGLAAAAVLFILPSMNRVGAQAPLYTVQDLGTIDGAVPNVTGINASGEVSGYAIVMGRQRAVRFRDGSWSYVPGLPSDVSTLAFGINDHGDIVGYQLTAAGPRAYRYTDATGVIDLVAPLPGGTFTTGMAINNNGEVVGQANVPGGTRAWRAAPGLPAVALPTFGGTFGTACGINESGQIVGQASFADNTRHAYRVDVDGTITDLGTFDGKAGSSSACGIDAEGHVSGQAQASGQNRAFLFAGGLTNIDAFGGTSSSAVATVNGTTIGFFNLNGPRAFAHTAKEGSFDLNTRIPADSGWVLQQAKAVNAAGVVVGTGTLNGATRAFMVMPPAADTTPPTINSVSVTPSSIVPPNKAMVAVSVAVNATDDRDVSPTCSVSGIDGHGAPAENYSVSGALSGYVRAVGGSTYTFFVTCEDIAGNSAQGSADVVVPPDTTGPVFTNLSATPATIWPPLHQMVTVAISAAATDDSGDVPVCLLGGITGSDSTPSGDFAVTGTYTFNEVCTDSSGNSSWAATAVYVPPDTTAPVINSVSASPYLVWPPNGKMVPVTVTVSATDDADPVPACSISSITASEVAPGDAVITGNLTAQVRATKDANNAVRVYTLHVTCADSAGNRAEKTVDVRVAKDSYAGTGLGNRDHYPVAKR